MKKTRKYTALVALLLALTLLSAACGFAPAEESLTHEPQAPVVQEPENPMPEVDEPESVEPEADESAQVEPAAQSDGEDFTSFTASDMYGETVDQSIFAGHKLTMINIWGTFCGPCIAEMPDLGEISREYADKGVQVAGIIVDAYGYDGDLDPEAMDAAEQIIAQTEADYLHILPNQQLNDIILNDVYAVPTTVFVDEAGRIVGNRYEGSMSKSDWTDIIDGLLSYLDSMASLTAKNSALSPDAPQMCSDDSSCSDMPLDESYECEEDVCNPLAGLDICDETADFPCSTGDCG